MIETASSLPRRADPFRDLLLIDKNAPRFNQTVVALGSLVAVASGFWPLLGLLGAQLLVSVLFGRRYCLPCLFYFEVVQPRVGEGELEDARAPRFANLVGAAFLLGATVLWASGFPLAGGILGGVVATLAGLAATTGLCVGCEVYRLWAKVRGVRGGRLDRLDLEGLGAPAVPELAVLFTHPLCGDCQTVAARLARSGRPLVTVDVSKRKDLAKKYGVTLVPLALSVGPDGRVRERLV